jgi:DNA-directed RNA polymerase subunit RPC12/RpoP
MTRPRCPVCGQRVLWTSAFLFESEVLMHARCWPPLRRLLDRAEKAPTEARGRAEAVDRNMTCPRCKKDTLRHHTHSERDRRRVTTRCAECGWVDTTSWVEKRPASKRRTGEDGRRD